MNRVIIAILLMLSLTTVKAQKFNKEKAEINTIIGQFRECIIKKDSATFIKLFTPEAFVWAGVLKNRNVNLKNCYFSNYHNFYKFLTAKEKQEEVFKNIRITNDDVIGSVVFDYSYLEDGKMTNKGKEFWHTIKMNGKWKIVSVIYSIGTTDS